MKRGETWHLAMTVCATLLTLGAVAAGRQSPWTKEKAWEWYDAQPWIRGCNYMPASCANRVDQWQTLGARERFEGICGDGLRRVPYSLHF